jgi:ADP-ribose pyrophosphatase
VSADGEDSTASDDPTQGTDPSGAWRLLSRREVYQGGILSVVCDEVALPGGGSVRRDVVRNLGAVAVAALDADDQVVLIHQYRHPLGRSLWELPAGLLDLPGESPLLAAQRELAEEVDLVAGSWDLLVELHTSPGFTTEQVTVFLARELTDVPVQQRHVRHAEESLMTVSRVPLDEAVRMAQQGELTNGPTVAGVFAAARARDERWATLRPAG